MNRAYALGAEAPMPRCHLPVPHRQAHAGVAHSGVATE